MRLYLIVTPGAVLGRELGAGIAQSRKSLAARKVLYPRAPGAKNHTRLFMSHLDKGHRTQLRSARGYAADDGPDVLRAVMLFELEQDLRAMQPQKLILCDAHLLGNLTTVSELERLRGTLLNLSTDIRIILHVDEPARVMARHYASQIWQGRTLPLTAELDLARGGNWFADAMARHAELHLPGGPADEIDLPPAWLDYDAVVRQWEDVFGYKSVDLLPVGDNRSVYGDLSRIIETEIPAPEEGDVRPGHPDLWLARGRAINGVFQQLTLRGEQVDRRAYVSAHNLAEVDGPPIEAGALSAISEAMATGNANLIERAPALADVLAPPPALPDWIEPDPGEEGFRATHYVAAVMGELDKRTAEAARKAAETPPEYAWPGEAEPGKPTYELPSEVDVLAARLRASRYAPHNGLSAGLADTARDAPFDRVPVGAGGEPRVLAVTCMKNEGPFILEWIAYHRAVGITDFLIYTNDCDDGTDELLKALDGHGIIQHRNNNNWKGQSPQKAALNLAVKEEVVENADWMVHFDTDEFINIKTGNGRLADLFAAVPGASAFSLTWRTFGHNDVVSFEDRPIIGQFTAASPTYVPKPHTLWGFKTLYRNLGVYKKMSCHRPTHAVVEELDKVVWVNGSGQVMPQVIKEKGWRSDITNIGYDLVQLNHYALRSAESFLVKRQRGRALHVDRSIGRNYWIRNDWNDFLDDSILRNLPRVEAELADLKALDGIGALHQAAVARHRAKIAELRQNPEFADLLTETTSIKINALQRVAYSLMLDIADRGA